MMVDAVESRVSVCPVKIPPQPDVMDVVSNHIDMAGVEVARHIYERFYVANASSTDKDPYKGWRHALSGRIIRAAFLTTEPEIDAYIQSLPNHGENSLVDSSFAQASVSHIETVCERIRTPLKNPQKITEAHEPRIAEIYKEYEAQVERRSRGKTAAQELSQGLDSLDFNATSLVFHLNRVYDGRSKVRILKNGLVSILDESYDSLVYPQASMHDDDSIFLFGRVVYMNDLSAEGFFDHCIEGEGRRRFSAEVIGDLREFRSGHRYNSARVGCPALFDGTLPASFDKMVSAVKGT